MAVLGMAGLPACDALSLVGFALWPDVPSFRDGDRVELPGLEQEVRVHRRPDGLWRVEADREADAMRTLGYLQARDRLGQIDLFRHLARGELAQWLGDRPFGEGTALDVDRRNRFLGFRERAAALFEATSASERAALVAFVGGINHWIATGERSLEHRLLGVTTVRPWEPEDSLAIYQMIMHGLGGNADREIRRLRLACAVGIDAALRIWPGDIEFERAALPRADWPSPERAPDPVVVDEMRAELPGACASGAGGGAGEGARVAVASGPPWLAALSQGWSASNNWVVSGAHTRSGGAILSSDPHLPYMNPPLVWGYELILPETHVVGFSLPGLHRVVFGHNHRVAWGATTNHVDRQDLVVHREVERDGRRGVEREGGFEPYEVREEVFHVRGGESVTASVRFTRDGPLLNDLDPGATAGLPPVALRRVGPGRGSDLDGAAAMNRARTASEFAQAVGRLELGCSSWLFADSQGHIGYRSPCRVPIREGWRGTFAIPGWLDRYAWRGVHPKSSLPSSDDPARGWLATANGLIVPSVHFPTPYNNDVSASDRFRRIAGRLASLRGNGGVDIDGSAAIQVDARLADWPAIRRQLAAGPCSEPAPAARPVAVRLLCNWDGEMSATASAPALFTLWTHALLDRALADELPGGAGDPLWHYVQSLLQFEANAHWLWRRGADDPVWDDVRTERRETRAEQVARALEDAVAEAERRWGGDVEAWRWGRVRPFWLKHPFASDGGPLGWLVNVGPLEVDGGTETVFKQQFARSDRSAMAPAVGPIVRFTVDLAEPSAARFGLAGGESGWPGSPHYADLLEDWSRGRGRPLTPEPGEGDVRVRFVPAPGV
ncbi:MAG: penicillin acylase family protein [Myxococcota bacterium]